jgi:hypothetical protein
MFDMSGIKTDRKKRIVAVIIQCLHYAILDDRLYTSSDLRRTAKIIYKRVAEEIGWDDKRGKESDWKA